MAAVSIETFQKDVLSPPAITSPRSVEILRCMGLSSQELSKQEVSYYHGPFKTPFQAKAEWEYFEGVRRRNLRKVSGIYEQTKRTGVLPLSLTATVPGLRQSMPSPSRPKSPPRPATGSPGRRGDARRGLSSSAGPKVTTVATPTPSRRAEKALVCKSKKEINDLLFREYSALRYRDKQQREYSAKLRRMQLKRKKKTIILRLQREEKRVNFRKKRQHIRENQAEQLKKRAEVMRERELKQSAFFARRKKREEERREENEARKREKAQHIAEQTRKLQEVEKEKYVMLLEKEHKLRDRLLKIDRDKAVREKKSRQDGLKKAATVRERIQKKESEAAERLELLIKKQKDRDSYLQKLLLERFRDIEVKKFQRHLRHKEKRIRGEQKRRADEYKREMARKRLEEEDERLASITAARLAKKRKSHIILERRRREKIRLNEYLYYLKTNHSERKFRTMPEWVDIDFDRDVIKKFDQRQKMQAARRKSSRAGAKKKSSQSALTLRLSTSMTGPSPYAASAVRRRRKRKRKGRKGRKGAGKRKPMKKKPEPSVDPKPDAREGEAAVEAKPSTEEPAKPAAAAEAEASDAPEAAPADGEAEVSGE